MMPTTTDLGCQQQQQQQQQHHDTRTTRGSKKVTSTTSLRLLVAAAAFILPFTAQAMVYEVSTEGEPYSLTAALAEAGPGDTISLADGTYGEPIVTMAGGEEGSPLVIEGGRGAVITAFSGDKNLMWSQKVVDVRHSWITLKGFTVDGKLDDEDVEESYVDKCIFIEGQAEPTMVDYRGSTVKSALIGFVMDGMHITNCGMECVRARNYVTHSVISNNIIENCGIYDFRFQFDSVIGEAIYLGTSSNQWTTFPDDSNYQEFAGEGYPDESNYNLITGNTLTPRGNECVDVKEGASFNVIEFNECSEQLDEESGCYDSRGNENTFRYNTASNCDGGGIRLGGHEIDGFVYGVDNIVYGNDFEETGDGSIKSRQEPQGLICGNSCSGSGDCEVSEEGDDEEIESTWDQPCPETLPTVPYIDDEVPAPSPPSEEMPMDVTFAPVAAPVAETNVPAASPVAKPTVPAAPPAAEPTPSPIPVDEMPPPVESTQPSGGSTCIGILSPQGMACCAESCGTCGGIDCSARSPGADSCCVSNILETAEPCSFTDMIGPCKVDDNVTPKTTAENNYIGCFPDKGNTGRIMEYAKTDSKTTTESCAEDCKSHKFFGTQYGNECWCGDGGADGKSHLTHGGNSETDCNMECEGARDQTCGGKWFMSVYEH